MQVRGQIHAPGTSPPGKEPQYTLDRLGGPQSQSGRCGVEKNFLPCRELKPSVQPVVRRYTDWAIPALIIIIYFIATLIGSII
jgi:hypothetical protein